jgi:IMP cyclohydrolase
MGAALRGNAYPGRGLICAGTDGGVLVAYFVTGRSPASQEREIRVGAGGELIVAPLVATADDACRHYEAAIMSPEWLVCGNGRQVATVMDRLAAGHDPAVALDGLEHEPDEPIFTDRITAVVSRKGDGRVVLGVAGRSAGNRTSSDVVTMTMRGLAPGDAVLLTTYRSDGRTIASGRPPVEVHCDDADPGSLLETVWAALDPALRVSAVVIDPAKALDQALIRNR